MTSDQQNAGSDQLHPLVAAVLVGGPSIGQVLARHPELRTPIVYALKAIQEAKSDKRSVDEAFRIAGAVDIAAENPQLAIFFMHIWGTLAYKLARSGDKSRLGIIPSLARQTRVLLSDDSPEVVRLLVLAVEHDAAAMAGNMLGVRRILDESLKLCTYEHNMYWYFLENRVLHYAQFGQLSECGEIVASLEKKGSKFVLLARFVQAITSGHYEEAGNLLPDAEADPSLSTSVDMFYYRQLLTLWRDRWSRLCPQGPLQPGFPPWAVATDELLARRPDRALDAVRPGPEVVPEEFLCEKGFDAYSLIRAELACGHGEAAGRLLALRRERGNTDFMDDFFLARAALLGGDWGSAARHFAAVVRACDRYDCRPALDFELRLACELAPGDLARLVQAVAVVPEGAEGAPESSRIASQAPPRGLARLVGRSAALERIREQVTRLAPLDASVLLVGETGTGKELIARAIHEEGPRGNEQFVAVNCGAVSDNLLESELFGHQRGAFTGATQSRRGLFEEAGRGTILLDEIGEISPRLQVALLRVLESGEIRPVGASQSRKIACRIISATNADLEALSEKGIFRKDLFFRLKRLDLRVPPLRERREDVVTLALHFLGLNRTDGRQPEISAELASRLTRYDWPGNVRELANLVERLRIMNSDCLLYDQRSFGLESLLPEVIGGARSEQPKAQSGAVATTEPAAREYSAAAASAAVTDGQPTEVERLIAEGRTALRRLDRLRSLFSRHGKLTRAEVAVVLRISTRTATRDLAQLCREGVIERVKPSRSSRSHYFRLRSS